MKKKFTCASSAVSANEGIEVSHTNDANLQAAEVKATAVAMLGQRSLNICAMSAWCEHANSVSYDASRSYLRYVSPLCLLG